MDLSSVPDSISFPREEEAVLAYWESIDAFRASVEQSRKEGRPAYTFYDGPPFATGLPHYGHILAGTIKDIVTRYAHQTGHHVERRFGWDCHGLPIEFEIEQQLGIKTRADVLKFGIENYNRECRAIVMRYAGEWRRIVSRVGRWIDFDNDYKTMHTPYMESVWWVFSQLFEKGLVYRGFKVMPYSLGCATPLSNFEANMNYKDVSDPAVTVSFPLVDEPDVSFVAWTTTPWTLPSNLALCINAELPYVKIRDEATGKTYICAEARAAEVSKKHTVLAKISAKDLLGKRYVPLFPYFANAFPNAFRVIADSYVTSESGTGIVHIAPAFGEDDYRVSLANGVVQKADVLPAPIDDNGFFTAECPEFQTMFIKDADKAIQKTLKEHGRLVKAEAIIHSYPFCWRSEKPLIYKAVPSWFVKVESIKEQLLRNNGETYWVPSFVKEKRFHNWLQDARDWAVSRNRYWGTPIPVWANEDCSEIVCISSIEQLQQLSGVANITDLHREHIDGITIPSQKRPGTVLRRIEEVFDCWFESGAMPYASVHYPFENKENFSFPGDFIAEGLDQTRGWFYTLMVLSTALFDRPAFKNLIVNGLVLAEDGKKMSKRLKNYPDPQHVIDTYGADALRLYLINSPVVRAEPLRFKEAGVKDIVKDVLLPWFNAFRFLAQSMQRLKIGVTDVSRILAENPLTPQSNVMDRWITSATQSLLAYMKEEMGAYRLYTVVPRLLHFLNDLTNGYVRMNRNRIKTEPLASAVLYRVLITMARALAPFTPFMAEYMYLRLRVPSDDPSVHMTPFPEADNSLLDLAAERKVQLLMDVLELGRNVRDRAKRSLKMPLRECVIISRDPTCRADLMELSDYVSGELNVLAVLASENEAQYVEFVVAPEMKVLGKRLGKRAAPVVAAVKNLVNDMASLNKLVAGESVTLTLEDGSSETVTPEDVQISRKAKAGSEAYEAASNGAVVVLLDVREDEGLLRMKQAREVASRVQQLRKKYGLNPADQIHVKISGADSWSAELKDLVAATTKVYTTFDSKEALLGTFIGAEEVEGEDGVTYSVCLARAVARCAPSVDPKVRQLMLVKALEPLQRQLASHGKVTVTIDGHEYTVVKDKDIFV